MPLPSSSWLRVASGLRIVANNGASRISHAIFSNDPQSVVSNASKHLPEVSASMFGKGITGYGVSDASDAVLQRATTVISDVAGNSFNETNYQSFAGSKNAENVSASSQIGNVKSKYNNSEQTSIESYTTTKVPMEAAATTATSMLVISHDANNDNTDGTKATIETKNPEKKDQESERTDYQYTESLGDNDDHQNQHLPEGSAVPATRISRAFGFATLGAGLAVGTAAELARRTFGRITSQTNTSNNDPLVLSNSANAQRLSKSLRRMRGAAMKLGQMLSIQDESIAPPALTNALAQVRKGAEAMPTHQLMKQIGDQWGEGWREKIDLEALPFAAASIGQVHRGILKGASSSKSPRKVAVKVQYPGVADSIESDLSNLSMLVQATGLAPPGLFLENVIRVGRDELKVECDYRRELEHQKRFKSLISSDPVLVAERFVVPDVIEELSTDRILVTEYVHGGTIDKVVDLDASERNRIGRAIMRLTMFELFVWKFMQTDPNWGNFLYDVRTRTTYLIDFGAAREYDEEFVRGYLKIVVANANQDEETLMKESIRMGFLTGEENELMLEAHKLSGFCLGEPFQSYEPYDFKASKITSRISEHGSVFLRHRLTPPPEEVYTLHRKLAGAYNLCIKLGAIVSCRDLLDEVTEHFKSKDSQQASKSGQNKD